MLGALEHEVLEQVVKPRLAGQLVLRTHVVPDVDRHNRRLAVGVDHDRQAIREGEFFVRDQFPGGRDGNCHRRGHALRGTRDWARQAGP